MLVTKQLMVAIYIYSIFPILYKPMAAIKCLVTSILQNIFYAKQNKDTYTGLEQLWRMIKWQNFQRVSELNSPTSNLQPL